jgi:hypothetical protein
MAHQPHAVAEEIVKHVLLDARLALDRVAGKVLDLKF